MFLHIKILGGKEIYPTVSENANISDVKYQIEKENGIPVSQQKLVFKGKTLSNDKNLSDYSITDFSKLHLVVKKSDVKKEKVTEPVDQTPKYTADDFWLNLENILLKQYDTLNTQLIMQQYKADYKQMLTTMSLDDIERIAARQLKS